MKTHGLTIKLIAKKPKNGRNCESRVSDLDIPIPNWIDAVDHAALEPLRFKRVLAKLHIAFEDYTFVDYGCGKGRAWLLASEFPFKRIIGPEFSPELHSIAEDNILRCNSRAQKCRESTLLTWTSQVGRYPRPVGFVFP